MLPFKQILLRASKIWIQCNLWNSIYNCNYSKIRLYFETSTNLNVARMPDTSVKPIDDRNINFSKVQNQIYQSIVCHVRPCEWHEFWALSLNYQTKPLKTDIGLANTWKCTCIFCSSNNRGFFLFGVRLIRLRAIVVCKVRILSLCVFSRILIWTNSIMP